MCSDRSRPGKIGDRDEVLGADEVNVNVLALVKPSGERYIYLFADDRRTELLRAFGRHAADPQLTFSWHDASVLSQHVRRAE